jgi:hypothetical protein
MQPVQQGYGVLVFELKSAPVLAVPHIPGLLLQGLIKSGMYLGWLRWFVAL